MLELILTEISLDLSNLDICEIFFSTIKSYLCVFGWEISSW